MMKIKASRKAPRKVSRNFRPIRRLALLSASVGLAFLTATPAIAQSGGIYEIRQSTIDGGGITPKSQAGFVVRGTIGQPDPGTLEGDTFQINGGFWLGGLALGPEIFADGFETGDTSRWTLTFPLAGLDQTESQSDGATLPSLEMRDLNLRDSPKETPPEPPTAFEP